MEVEANFKPLLLFYKLFHFPRIAIKRALMNFYDVCCFHKYEQKLEMFVFVTPNECMYISLEINLTYHKVLTVLLVLEIGLKLIQRGRQE